MAAIRLSATGSTLTVNGHVFNNLIEGDVIEVNPVNAKTSHVNGIRPGDVTISNRSDGDVHDVVVRTQRFSDDDVFLNNLLNSEFPEILAGSLKESFIRGGTEGTESWILENGSLTDRPSRVKNTQDGNAVMQYTMRFRNAARSL